MYLLENGTCLRVDDQRGTFDAVHLASEKESLAFPRQQRQMYNDLTDRPYRAGPLRNAHRRVESVPGPCLKLFSIFECNRALDNLKCLLNYRLHPNYTPELPNNEESHRCDEWPLLV